MTPLISETALHKRDYLLLAGVCAALFGYALVDARILTMHEAVLPENAREMMLDRDWLVPKYGGRPWLERPPLPQWITVAVATAVGHCDKEWIVRLPTVVIGMGVVLLVAWMTSWWFGRAIGLLTGLVLPTMWEFYTYALDSESDMFLCAIVTGTIALFVHLEFRRRDQEESLHFLGRRSWPVLALFVLFGATNLAKGLIFGTLMAGVPIAGFLLWNLNLRALGRYTWAWGWLAFAAVALAWPVLVWCQYPDVIELWASDYVGRLNQGFIRESHWYYLHTVPWVILPWTIPAIVGLWQTARKAWNENGSPERFLWCWAVLTPLFFSIPQGKHHHYLLQCLAPWAVLSALGAVRVWEWTSTRASFALRNPAFALLTAALPLDLALAALGRRIPGPDWLVPALLVSCPIFIFVLHRGLTHPNPRCAAGVVVVLLTIAYCFTWSYKTHCYNRYLDDQAFLEQTQRTVPADKPILVNCDNHTLEAFRSLFYLGGKATLLHNFSYLCSDRIREQEVYVLARAKHAAELASYGSAEVILQSRKTRGEAFPGDRWTLYFLRFRADLQRRPENLYMRPMQAAGRAPGPFLN